MMKKSKIKNKKNILIIFLLLFLICLVSMIIVTFYKLSPIDSNNEEVIKFTVESGWGKSKIVSELKQKDLIRSEFFGKLLVKVKNIELYAGTYKLSKDLSTNEILDKISNQENIENETVTITFLEEKTLNYFVQEISKEFPYEEKEIHDKLSDIDYLEKLIDNYWFITDEILNKDIYYPLEGYLFPDTYEFKKNSTLEEIIEKILNNLENKLDDYKDDILLGEFTIHEYLTIASITEKEASFSDDRKTVAGVIHNRLEKGMTLGMDVTTYYAVQVDVGNTDDKDKVYAALNECNPYNTRGNCVKGLPVGPICNASLSSIVAAIVPEKTEYNYFVADTSKKLYFSKTDSEQAKVIRELKEKGIWPD